MLRRPRIYSLVIYLLIVLRGVGETRALPLSCGYPEGIVFGMESCLKRSFRMRRVQVRIFSRLLLNGLVSLSRLISCAN